MYLCVGACAREQAPVGRGWIPRARFMGGCEPPDMGSGNRALALQEQHELHIHILSSSVG